MCGWAWVDSDHRPHANQAAREMASSGIAPSEPLLSYSGTGRLPDGPRRVARGIIHTWRFRLGGPEGGEGAPGS